MPETSRRSTDTRCDRIVPTSGPPKARGLARGQAAPLCADCPPLAGPPPRRAGGREAKPPMAPQTLFSAARSTRGVAFILSFGCQPAVLNVEALEAIRDVERQLGLVDFHRPTLFRTGAKVRLAGENLYGIEGLVTSVSTKRVNVLIEILGGHRRIRVDHHQLELV